MKVLVNGTEKKVGKGATLKDAVSGEVYSKDSLISVHLSTDKLVSETNDFELTTSAGPVVLHLDDSDDARRWKAAIQSVEGISSRWVTKDIIAFGSFKSDIPLDKAERLYRHYDCFFSLGGFDNHTTYMMIARRDHRRGYGAGLGRIGRITVGRHLVDVMAEGETITSIRPMMSETSSENVVVTRDLTYPIEEGYRIETNMKVVLDRRSPESSEHMLIVGAKGYMNATDVTGSYMGCRDDMDIDMSPEVQVIRSPGSVTVRNSGVGKGHIMIYRERRQVSPSHNSVGMLERGMALAARASAGDRITLVTEPPRVLSVGMTQSSGEEFLSGFGVKQKRTGDTSDDAVIVDQIPEMTMAALDRKEVETFAVPRDRVFRISLSDSDAVSMHYFKKVTGLSHKTVGSMRVQFAFPDMPMVTFYGDEVRSKNLYPQNPFKKCRKGDIGVTNQSRPHHGLIGIRLQDSKEFGPTGEEPYGTNIVGRFLGDMSHLGEIEEDQTIYITEEDI